MDFPTESGVESRPGRIGRYEVLSVAKMGGFTAVYKVRHPISGQPLALKTSSPDRKAAGRAAAEQALRREGEVRAALDHPAILPLYDMAASASGLFLVGPWLPGGTLFQRWRHRLPLDATIAIIEQIGAGLDALHARGWIHGDLSPNNIVFDGSGRLRITDFGSCMPIGVCRTLPMGELATEAGAHWRVTRLTAAPELFTGGAATGRTDLYSLGVILYFLLVGSWPFINDDPDALIRMHIAAPIPIPSEHNTMIGHAVDGVVLRVLAKRPEERYGTGRELAAALRAAVASLAAGLAPPFQPAVTTAADPSFVPIAVPPATSLEARKRAQAAIANFMATLPTAERQTFSAALAALRRQGSAKRSEFGGALRKMAAPLSALRAAEDLGLLRVLGQGPRSTAEIASMLPLPAENVERLCLFLKATGQLTCGNGRWSLGPLLQAAYERAGVLNEEASPVRLTQMHWATLASWVQTGKPATAMDADEDGSGYVETVKTLGDGGEIHASEVARALCERALIPDRSRILDVGAGSAVWSLALAARWPETSVTAFDRPQVLAVAVERAQKMGLANRLRTVAGSWQSIDLPGQSFGLILLCKVCHLESAAGLAALLQRLSRLLRPDGRLVIVDTIPEHLSEASSDVLRYDLSLALRTERGRIHERATYDSALAAAGLRICDFWSVTEKGCGLAVLVSGAWPVTVPTDQAPLPAGPSSPLRSDGADPRPPLPRSTQANLDLPTLLEPATEAVLRHHMRQRTLLHLPNNDPERFEPIFSWDGFFSLLQRGLIARDKIRITKHGAELSLGKLGILDSYGRIDGLAFRKLHQEGVSVILNRVAPTSPALWTLARDVEQRIGDRVEIAAIASLAETGALPAHYDFQDVIILQIAGVKHWTFLGHPVAAPRQLGNQMSAAPEAVTSSATLRPGDVLYVPRGQYHVCRAEERSLHLGLVLTRRTGDHFMTWLAKRCESDELFAATLPRYLGEDELARHDKQIKDRLHQLIDEVSLSEFLDADDAAELAVADLDLFPPAAIHPTYTVRLATLRRVPLPHADVVTTLQRKGLTLELTPVRRAVLALINRELVLPVGRVLSLLAPTYKEEEIEGALRVLAATGLLSIRPGTAPP